MNLYGVVTGTDDYALNVSLPPGFQLCIGDTITINPINANTGSATLSVGGLSPLPLTLNGSALTGGQLEAGKDRQCTFKGSGFACDNAGGAGGASFVGTSSNLTLGDGSAGIVPAGNFGNLSAADIPDLDTAKITTGQFVDGRMPTASNAATIGAISTVANAAVPKSTVDAKGDLLVGTANDTVGRLAVGSNGQVLTADSAEATGAKWATVSATDSTKIAKAGDTGIGGDLLTSAAIRIGPGTSDGSDNSLITLGHSGLTRGGGILSYGNEHANLGRVDVQPGYVGTNCLFRVLGFSGGAVFTVDGYGGQVTAVYGVTTPALSCSGPLTFSSTSSPTMGMGRDGLGNLGIVSTWALNITAPGGTSVFGTFDVQQTAVAVANTTFTTVRSVTFSPCRISVFVYGVGGAELYWDGTTLSVWKSLADTNVVAAASAGAGEVAWRMSGTNLQASNNTGSSKNCYAGFARR